MAATAVELTVLVPEGVTPPWAIAEAVRGFINHRGGHLHLVAERPATAQEETVMAAELDRRG